MHTKSILLATALSIAVMNPSNATTQIPPAVTNLSNANIHSGGFDTSIVRVKNDKDKGGDHRNSGKGHEKKKNGKQDDKNAQKKTVSMEITARGSKDPKKIV